MVMARGMGRRWPLPWRGPGPEGGAAVRPGLVKTVRPNRRTRLRRSRREPAAPPRAIRVSRSPPSTTMPYVFMKDGVGNAETVHGIGPGMRFLSDSHGRVVRRRSEADRRRLVPDSHDPGV